VYGHSNSPKCYFSSYPVMRLVHIEPWVNGHVLGRAMAVAARQKVPHHQYASRDPCGDHAYQHPLLTQKSYRRLLQLTSYAFGTYKALGKRASAREGICVGGQTKSAPARRYDHILECMVTPTVQNVTSPATQLCIWYI
jgi:hypothetical protein